MARDHDGFDASGPDVLGRRTQTVKNHVDVASDQVLHGRSGAPVRDVGDEGLGLKFEQFTGHVVGGAAAGAAVVEPAWVLFDQLQKLFQVVAGDVSESAIVSKLVASSTSTNNHVSTAKLVLNGNDRFAQRDGLYFNLVQPFQHHENVPQNAGINVYSFALKPEEHQPSGTLNMSRIDTAVLNLSMNSSKTYDGTTGHNLNVYAVNYNVLRIMSGMGGIAYSN